MCMKRNSSISDHVSLSWIACCFIDSMFCQEFWLLLNNSVKKQASDEPRTRPELSTFFIYHLLRPLVTLCILFSSISVSHSRHPALPSQSNSLSHSRHPTHPIPVNLRIPFSSPSISHPSQSTYPILVTLREGGGSTLYHFVCDSYHCIIRVNPDPF